MKLEKIFNFDRPVYINFIVRPSLKISLFAMLLLAFRVIGELIVQPWSIVCPSFSKNRWANESQISLEPQ